MRGASIGLLLVTALLAWAPSAWARDVDASGETSGDITVSWHGDPTRGCAPAGVCDVSGSLTYRPASADVYGQVYNGRFHPEELYLTADDPSSIRVHRQTPAGAEGICLDRQDNDFNLELRRQSKDRYRLGLDRQGLASDGFSSGRCTGPVAQELASVFPSGTIDALALLHHSAVLDMRQREPFVAGPFVGELVSTVRSRLGRASTSSETVSGPFDSGRPHKTRELALSLVYDVAQASGSLGTTFIGSGEPFCVPFDSCGVRGSTSYSLALPQGGTTLQVFASRILRGHERPTLRSALQDLRAGRLELQADFDEPDLALGHVTSSLTRLDGSTCAASGSQPTVEMKMQRGRAGAHFVLGPPDSRAVDTLRTDCPGPSESDVISESPVASGDVPLSKLAGETARIRLRTSSSFSSAAYQGTRSGEIDLQLARTSIRVGVSTVYYS